MSEFGGYSAASALTPEQAQDILQSGDIVEEYGLLRYSSNYAFLVGIRQAGDTLTTVYKPQNGERPLWDFPDGTLCLREYAAYLTSQQLGWQIVPPTVLREGRRGLGSFQLFIDHDPDQHYFTFDDAQKQSLKRMVAFDCMVNNADRKGGHCLLDSSGHIWGIDHGITFHVANKLRTVLWDFAGESVPDDVLTDMEQLCAALEQREQHPYAQALAGLISAQEYRAFQGRIRRLLRDRVFPTPGPGPNYPWPPV